VPVETKEEELAAGGDVEVAIGLLSAPTPPPSHQVPVVTAVAEPGEELDVASRKLRGTSASAGSWAGGKAPGTESALQHYAGRLSASGVCRYTARKHGRQDAPAPEAVEAPLPQVSLSRSHPK